MYLGPSARSKWKQKVVFIEPHENPRLLTVVHISIAPVGQSFNYIGIQGANLADLKLNKQLHVPIDVTYENINIISNLDELIKHIVTSQIAKRALGFPSPALLIHGFNKAGARHLMALPMKLFFNNIGV